MPLAGVGRLCFGTVTFILVSDGITIVRRFFFFIIKKLQKHIIRLLYLEHNEWKSYLAERISYHFHCALMLLFFQTIKTKKSRLENCGCWMGVSAQERLWDCLARDWWTTNMRHCGHWGFHWNAALGASAWRSGLGCHISVSVCLSYSVFRHSILLIT